MLKILIAVTCLTLSMTVHAVTVSYQYTSGAFTPSPIEGNAITNLSLSFTADLAAGLGSSAQLAAVSSWTVSDGVNTITNSSAGYVLDTFLVSTNAQALITGLEVTVLNNRVVSHTDPHLVGELLRVSLIDKIILGRKGNPDQIVQSAAATYCSFVPDTPEGTCGPVQVAEADSVIGGVSAVPIPAAAWLFGSALLGLGVVKRKKA